MFGRWINKEHRITSNATAKTDSNRIGEIAEKSACKWLQQQGLTLIQKNYRCRTGEIDLIMHDNEHLIFVEVRFRSRNHFGSAAASVDHRKQRKLIHAASHFLTQQSPFNHLPCRFDVIAAQAPDNNAKIPTEHQWSWLKSAFTT